MSKIEDFWPVALRQELFSEYVFNDMSAWVWG